MKTEEQTDLTDRLVRAAIQLYAELGMVEIDGGLNTLDEFASALDAMPQTANIRDENARRLEQAIALMMAEPC